MISRVAESCFWLHRYIERLDNTARLLDINRTFVLDVRLPAAERWRPLLVVAGEAPRFGQLYAETAAEDEEVVQEYMTWSQENPVSLLNSAHWARENTRTIREVASREMWNTINAFWLWLKGGSGRRLYNRERSEFYFRCSETAQLFRGISHDTMLHEEPFDFMRLGMLLERAGQTARFLDVKYHVLGPTEANERETAAAYAQWSAILRSCSATESFLKRGRPLAGANVAEFLILDSTFPRSILHCVDRAWNFLRRIRPQDRPEVGERSAELLETLRERLVAISIEEIVAGGMHDELTRIVGALARVGEAVAQDYFDPPPVVNALSAAG